MRVYKTSKVVLRELDLRDTELLYNFLLDNRDFLKPWEPLRTKNYFEIDNIKSLINSQITESKSQRGFSLGIFVNNDSTLIGQVTISNIVYGPFLSCFLGYKLGEKFTGNGYMSEAIKLVIDICFNEYKLHRIEANVMPRNLKSSNVLKRLNFKNEGLSHDYLKINGKWEDHNHYVILNNSI